MKNFIFYTFILTLFFFFGCAEMEFKPLDDVKKVFKQNIITDSEITTAFKQLLQEGTTHGVNLLSANEQFLKDPAVTIPFPKEAQKVEQTLRKIGLSDMCDDFHKSMNLAAQNAVSEATPLFINAIKNITFEEATKLLKGQPTAVTDFLKNKTSVDLTSKFTPIISTTLEKNKVTNSWNKIVTKYNKLPLVKPIQSDLSAHVAQKTIDGLFVYIGKEEVKIRNNPAARTTELLKKVFSSND